MQKNYTSLYGKILFLLLAVQCTTSKLISAQTYCTPVNTTSCSVGGGDYINSFSTTGGTTNISSLNTGCNGNANNYIYYSTQTLTAIVGNPVSFSLSVGFNQELAMIWIDYDHDGTFAATELVYGTGSTAIPANSTATGSFTIPATATTGTTRMRVRCSAYFYPFTPCGSTLYGETEDYNVILTSNGIGTGGCTGMPVAGTIISSSTAACPSGYNVLMLTGNTNSGVTYQWHANGVVIAGASGPILTISQSVATAYTASVICGSSGLVANTPPFTLSMAAPASCQDSVWPGDVNYDHIVNNLDILSMGLSYGLTGPSRSVTGIVFQPDFAMDWPASFLGGINKKNADCNGDGIIGWSDTLAVSANYGLTHVKDGLENAERGAGLPDLKVDFNGLMPVPGHTYTVPIRFGSSASPVPKIYGLAATLKCSGAAMQSAPSVSFSSCWLAGVNNLLYLSHPVNSNNVDFAVSRISHRDTTGGYGTIGSVTFTVPANASGKMIFNFQNVTVVDSSGNTLTGYNVLPDTANIQPTGIGQQIVSARISATIVPNPGNNSSLVVDADHSSVSQLYIYDVRGSKVFDAAQYLDKGSNKIQLPVKDFPAGFYTIWLKAASAESPVILKWIKE